MSAQEISPAMILLLVGGLLAVGVQLPVINEMLPMVEADNIDGGLTLLGEYGDVAADVDGWTMLGLDGMILWILVIIGGILCIIPAANKFQPFLPEMEAVPGGLPFLLAIIGGVIQIVLALLILIGDSEDIDAFGLSTLDPTGATVGFGFYVMLIAAIVCIVGAVLTYLEETAA
ncbi:MAG: hypothetical protein ACE5OZ_13755 [Candidatus Heimdallarchaeota archaeon]